MTHQLQKTYDSRSLEDGQSENLWIFSKQRFEEFCSKLSWKTGAVILFYTWGDRDSATHPRPVNIPFWPHPRACAHSLPLCSDPVLVLLCTASSPVKWACRSSKWSRAGLWYRQTCIWAPDHPSPSCVTLGKELNISELCLLKKKPWQKLSHRCCDINKTVWKARVCSIWHLISIQ